MPHKHRVKTYVENGFYHVYNRGVEKRDIFMDKQDFKVFLHLLKYYLSPKNQALIHPLSKFENLKPVRIRPLKNLSDEVDLLAYCLMPNHFHLLIMQKTKNGMTKLLRKILTVYAMYFNKRYERVGTLFQGRYKAALVTKDSYLLHLTRYIHLNPYELLMTGTDPVSYPYTSYKYYLKEKSADWIKPDFILKFFDDTGKLPFLNNLSSYKTFTEAHPQSPRDVLGNLTID